jgi:hypothetical protein
MEEIEDALSAMLADEDVIIDVENSTTGSAMKMGVFDAMQAVRQSLINSVSIATSCGTLGGIVVQPRIRELELQDARDELSFKRTMDNAENNVKEANLRP